MQHGPAVVHSHSGTVLYVATAPPLQVSSHAARVIWCMLPLTHGQHWGLDDTALGWIWPVGHPFDTPNVDGCRFDLIVPCPRQSVR